MGLCKKKKDTVQIIRMQSRKWMYQASTKEKHLNYMPAKPKNGRSKHQQKKNIQNTTKSTVKRTAAEMYSGRHILTMLFKE